jgi:hypothetical protein
MHGSTFGAAAITTGSRRTRLIAASPLVTVALAVSFPLRTSPTSSGQPVARLRRRYARRRQVHTDRMAAGRSGECRQTARRESRYALARWLGVGL